MPTKKTNEPSTSTLIAEAFKQWNTDTNTNWTTGTNWDNTGTEFETFVNKYLFPKLNETSVSTKQLGNRFDAFAQEQDFIGQYSEEYVLNDMMPVDLNLSKGEKLQFEANYPKMRTKLYGEGVVKKVKFTLNDNSARLNFSTIGDAVQYAYDVYSKAISSINIDEERAIKGMIVDYFENHLQNPTQNRTATSVEELASKLGVAILNIQNNSDQYNESNTASGGTFGRYTTYTALKDVMILTTDEVKAYLMDTKLANTFQVAGLDILDHVISFDDLGGTWRVNEDVTVTDPTFQRVMGDYQVETGDVIPKGSVLTYDISQSADFKGKVTEIKPSSELWAGVMDVKAICYKRYTKNMVDAYPMHETRSWNYLLFWYTFKVISPFYNKLVIKG